RQADEYHLRMRRSEPVEQRVIRLSEERKWNDGHAWRDEPRRCTEYFVRAELHGDDGRVLHERRGELRRTRRQYARIPWRTRTFRLRRSLHRVRRDGASQGNVLRRKRHALHVVRARRAVACARLAAQPQTRAEWSDERRRAARALDQR